MKKLLSLVLVLCLCAGIFAGCGAPKKDENILTMVTSPDFPPFEYKENGKIVGAEIEMIEAVAKKMGKKLEITEMEFNAILPGVTTGKYDIAVSGITADEDRRKNMTFSEPYYVAYQAIVVRKDSDIKTAADLKGKVIACQEGTTGEQYLTKNGYEIQSYSSAPDTIAALTKNKVDAIVIDNAVAEALSAEQNGATVVLEEALTQEDYAIAMKLGNDKLKAEIDKAIKELKEDGTLKKIFEKHGLEYVEK